VASDLFFSPVTLYYCRSEEDIVNPEPCNKGGRYFENSLSSRQNGILAVVKPALVLRKVL